MQIIAVNLCSRSSLRVQGRVRTKTVKRSARQIVEKYYGKLGVDFHSNKRVVDDVTLVPSKRMRNMIAGFTTVGCVNMVACAWPIRLHSSVFLVCVYCST